MDEKEEPGTPPPTESGPAETKSEVLAQAPAQTPRPARRRGGGFSVLLALIAIAIAGVAMWRVWTLEHAQDASQASERADIRQRIDTLSEGNAQTKRELTTLRTRLADADSVNRSLREELLGVTERSRNLEDAISHLAEQRLSGRDALALNEAEFLLQLAAERLSLFHDVEAAQRAYQLADSALAAAEDPLFASVRQTISAERQALAAAKFLPTRATLNALERLRAKLADLPGVEVRARARDTAPRSRFMQLLERFVRVRHDADVSNEFATRNLALSRSLVAIDLRGAEAALLARDTEAFRAALAQVHTGIERGFATDDATVRAALAEVERLAATPLAPTLPELGSALAELRNLRTTRALAHPPVPAASTPAAPAE